MIPRYRDLRIRRNCDRTFPTRLLTFDVEARVVTVDEKRQRHDCRLICWRYICLDDNANIISDTSGHTTDKTLFCRLVYRLMKEKPKLWIISSNIGYDVTVSGLLEFLALKKVTFPFIYINGLSVIIRCSKRGRQCVLLNSQNWYRSSTHDLGKLVGLPKIDIDTQTDNLEALIEYCQRDTDIIALAMVKLIQLVHANDWGEFGTTISSQADKTFRHRYMTTPIYAHNHDDVITLEARSYYGGMTRAYRIGEYYTEVYQLDVNSMYPYVMSVYEYPSRLIGVYDNPPVEYLVSRLKSCCVVADITYIPGKPWYPCKHNGFLIYPAYETRAVRTTREIENIVKYGKLIKVHKAAVYRKNCLFKEYVNDLSNLKVIYTSENRHAERQIIKLMLNSMYGIWARKSRTFVRVPEYDGKTDKIAAEIDMDKSQVSKIYYIGDMAFKEVVNGYLPTSMVAIASHITADARMYLCHIIDLVPIGDIYYTDTDSLIVSKNGYQILSDMIHDTKLGYLKLQQVADQVAIYGRKDYTIGNVIKLKGVPNPSCVDDNGGYTFTQWSSLRAILSPESDGHYYTRTVTKHLKRVVRDGTVDMNGIVHPYTSPPDW